MYLKQKKKDMLHHEVVLMGGVFDHFITRILYLSLFVYRLLIKPGIHDVRRSRLSSVGEVGVLKKRKG
jgi:hypothetical protein